jgi:hypothetical protein
MSQYIKSFLSELKYLNNGVTTGLEDSTTTKLRAHSNNRLRWLKLCKTTDEATENTRIKSITQKKRLSAYREVAFPITSSFSSLKFG